jgi:sialic acid synthase SpsE
MHPEKYREVLGAVFTRDVEKGEPLTGDMIR